MDDSGAIPIEKGVPGGRKGSGTPTFRFNPETGVGALSVEAYQYLGEPAKVDFWFVPKSGEIVIGASEDELSARKVSKKRTVSVSNLRDFLGVSGVRKWRLREYGKNSLAFEIEQGES